MRGKINPINFSLLLSGIAIIITMKCCEDQPDSELDQMTYDAAVIVNGGRLYDKFWADETDYVNPNDNSVLEENIEEFGDFYRCKACHGWDQKGSSGAYIDRSPNSGRPEVSSVQLTDSEETSIRNLFDAIKHSGGAAVDPARTEDGTNSSLGGNEMPDYGKILSDDQIWDIVKFLREGALDTDQLYTIVTAGSYPQGSRDFTNIGRNGDADIGASFYSQHCAACHGKNGRDDSQGNPLIINKDIGRSMGEFAREKPYELQHKARYGNLGSEPQMLGVPYASQDDIKNLLKALSDKVNYPDLN